MKQIMSNTKVSVEETALCASSATGGWLGRFWKAQDGAMSYVAVTGALIMMVFGGIGIDMIHAELKRNKIQNTLDRAVLAAAAVSNDMDAEQTVQEYFNAMGLADALGTVTVENEMTNKAVYADAATTMPSNFMSLLGVDTLQASGRARAEQGITQLEVSLVLDISGSMAGDKIEQLKVAAKNFVDILLPEGNDTPPVTISLVPYHATVNMGDDLPEYFALENLHDFAHCAIFDDSEFASTAIAPNDTLEQLGHFDPVSTSQNPGSNDFSWCNKGNQAAILPVSNDAALLKARIDNLSAWGNTAIDLGMKWGTALLDPAAQPAIAAMSADGLVAPENANRPVVYTDNRTLKFIVVMTDGQNTIQYDLPDDMKRAQGSGIWLADQGNDSIWDDKYSVLVQDNPGTDNDVYYWTRFAFNRNQRYQNTIDMLDHPTAPARELTWNELYDRFGTNGAANLLYLQPRWDGYISRGQYDALRNPYEEIVSGPQADSRLSQVCGVAKNQGIMVYAIGVEAPAAGLAAMQDCASSPAHYYDVTGGELDDTFAAIARSFQTLRLTQ